MKTFEEKWTAWVDGQLSGDELAEFKSALPDLAAAEADKENALKLGNLLREKIGVRAMSNQEFFQHQLMKEIESESRAVKPVKTESKVRETWWSIGRLAWTGAASLAIFLVCTFVVLRDTDSGGQSAYLTRIVNARIGPEVNPDATISIFEAKEDKVTVVWVEGLQSLPSEYAAK